VGILENTNLKTHEGFDMKFICLVYSVVALIGLTGCAGMQQAYQEQVCNDNGGYSQGMNDARQNKPMDQFFGQSCDAGSRDAAKNGYRRGYQEGLASVQTETPSTLINVNIGGSASTNKRFYCEAHAFTKTFSAWGQTELEGRVNAKNKCMESYNEMHCEDIVCRQ
jgi:hypothetical protein